MMLSPNLPTLLYPPYSPFFSHLPFSSLAPSISFSSLFSLDTEILNTQLYTLKWIVQLGLRSDVRDCKLFQSSWDLVVLRCSLRTELYMIMAWFYLLTSFISKWKMCVCKKHIFLLKENHFSFSLKAIINDVYEYYQWTYSKQTSNWSAKLKHKRKQSDFI